jgi:hypothetical protein
MNYWIMINPDPLTILIFLFLVIVKPPINYYLVTFFLLATVLRFPLRVRELFLVR